MNIVLKAATIVLLYAVCACIVSANEKKLRIMKYTSRGADHALAWQRELRSRLASLMKMDNLFSSNTPIPLQPRTFSSEKREKYIFHEMEINSTADRRIKIVLTLPSDLKGPFPAVVAVDGHGGTRHSCYEGDGFAHLLAERGYATVSIRVSQHDVEEKGRTLMGERLWDMMRCVDFLVSLEEVDVQRIGCAGNSLGGEMTMWLGAMDERVKATVSCGFLTRMDQLEENHCKCWKFPGLRELVDFADIYSMTAPRHLMCQNGLKELPTWFCVPVAREALKDIKVIYADFGKPDNLVFVPHEGGHIIDVPSLLTFFDTHLQHRDGASQQ